MFEHGRALQRIAQGDPVDKVLEEMAKRIVEKGLHPLLHAIRNIPTNYNAEESKKKYEDNMKNRKPSADHILDDLNA
jgi:glutamyl-tRNA reductase